MQDKSASQSDNRAGSKSRFNTAERVVLISGAVVLTAWIGALAWAGYELAVLII